MRVRVTNQELSCFNSEFKVEKMNYDTVLVIEEGNKMSISAKDVEFIAESPKEDVIISYRDIVKIRLNKGITAELYISLISCIKENNGEDIKKIDVLKDQYRIIRRGLWEKNLFLVINEKTPLDIHITGRNYDRVYDIWVTNLELASFIDECTFQIGAIQKELMEKRKLMKKYKKLMKKVINHRMVGFDSENKGITSGV